MFWQSHYSCPLFVLATEQEGVSRHGHETERDEAQIDGVTLNVSWRRLGGVCLFRYQS
jgi:hypothetical protein